MSHPTGPFQKLGVRRVVDDEDGPPHEILFDQLLQLDKHPWLLPEKPRRSIGTKSVVDSSR